jgi:hypothetical protein
MEEHSRDGSFRSFFPRSYFYLLCVSILTGIDVSNNDQTDVDLFLSHFKSFLEYCKKYAGCELRIVFAAWRILRLHRTVETDDVVVDGCCAAPQRENFGWL